MKRCHGRLHYDRKFQIFLFLIGCINVNKGVFCLIISYLRIKSYSVLNYNNCSTDWSFPLTIFTYHIAHKAFGRHNRKPFCIYFDIRSTAIQCLQYVYRPSFFLNILIPCYIFIKQLSLFVFVGGGIYV
jgi:hypothetical protein